MSSKGNPLDALKEVADHYDRIKGMNPHMPEEHVLETIAKATDQTKPNVRKRLKIVKGIDWPVIHYLENGVVGMNRVALLVDNDLTVEERTEILEKSLEEKVGDTAFKEYLARWIERKQAAQA